MNQNLANPDNLFCCQNRRTCWLFWRVCCVSTVNEWASTSEKNPVVICLSFHPKLFQPICKWIIPLNPLWFVSSWFLKLSSLMLNQCWSLFKEITRLTLVYKSVRWLMQLQKTQNSEQQRSELSISVRSGIRNERYAVGFSFPACSEASCWKSRRELAQQHESD